MYTRFHLQRVKKIQRKISFCNLVFVVTELFNIIVNDFDAKKSAYSNQVLVVTKLVVPNKYQKVDFKILVMQWRKATCSKIFF